MKNGSGILRCSVISTIMQMTSAKLQRKQKYISDMSGAIRDLKWTVLRVFLVTVLYYYFIFWGGGIYTVCLRSLNNFLRSLKNPHIKQQMMN
jgi:hypothetical protein